MDYYFILSLLILLAGFIIGLGAVTVIDLHGFLGRNSTYWTESTIRAHKVTKPLIWIGMILVIIGLSLVYSIKGLPEFILLQLLSIVVMIANGAFLSFYVSPRLLKREKEGKIAEILPNELQTKIFVGFVISFLCWWGNVLLTIVYLNMLINA